MARRGRGRLRVATVRRQFSQASRFPRTHRLGKTKQRIPKPSLGSHFGGLCGSRSVLIATVYPEVYPSDVPHPILARLEPSHEYIRPH
jgi:hypothetical protein